jgi:hypothetical protein
MRRIVDREKCQLAARGATTKHLYLNAEGWFAGFNTGAFCRVDINRETVLSACSQRTRA